MASTSDASPPAQPRRTRFLVRLFWFLLLATCIGWTLNQSGRLLNRSGKRAGFGLGIVQGALMPLALPNLAVGNDVTIYSENNTGRTYKLGYTIGVNGCGLLFFGIFFWRMSRWRRATQTSIDRIASTPPN